MKDTGNESFKIHDFNKAVTSYVQVRQLLKDVKAVRETENQMINDVLLMADRNLTIAALKNWEWGRATRACDMVSLD